MVNELVANAVPLVMESLCSRLHKLDLKSPLASMKLRYYDTCAPMIYFVIDVHTLEDFAIKIAGSAIEDIWLGFGSIDFTVGDSEEAKLSKLLADGYELMCFDEEELGRHGFTEADCFVSRRIALDVCWQLNTNGLPSTVKAGKNFFAHAQNSTDGIQIYADILKSIPQEKLQKLRKTEVWFDGIEKNGSSRILVGGSGKSRLFRYHVGHEPTT